MSEEEKISRYTPYVGENDDEDGDKSEEESGDSRDGSGNDARSGEKSKIWFEDAKPEDSDFSESYFRITPAWKEYKK